MTPPIQNQDALKPCPCGFCGITPKLLPNQAMPEGVVVMHGDSNDCVLSGFYFPLSTWNTRIPQSDALPDLVEALEDAVATLLAVRATASSPDDWATAAGHFSRVCRTSIKLASAALTKAKALPNPEEKANG